MNSQPDIKAIKQRADSVPPGPWHWDGSVDTSLMLACWITGRGLCELMSFKRMGMQGAQPVFWEWRCQRHQMGPRAIDGRDAAIFEVCPEATDRSDPRVYRGDINGFRHPVATFIACARQDVDDLLAYVDDLLAYVDDLERRLEMKGER